MRFPIVALTLALAGGVSLAATSDSALVHMLVPGCTVRELPVRLSNLNNLRFAPDGRLFALGYDGRIHVLRDTNGDGLEDTDELFWDQPTLTVPVGMALAPAGVYVSSHGKISLLHDTDGDGKADQEEIIANGWPPTDVASGGVDASALTVDMEGNIYFGLLVADYANPYRLRKRKDLKPEEKVWLVAHNQSAEGDPEAEVSLYDLNSVRGTIQKWSPKTKKLETIATGIRVPYALAFNLSGDLFVTDQEGETWCPNGNPLDELNHIIPGRNYGFPPRHEKWLPKLVSEPPVVAFGPQHQSTCGLVFNEPKAGQGLFGPKWWAGDAFVAGESRGKIWRVRLVKTPHGYVGKEYLIARLSMLTTDVAISPKGDLYVSCHSGLPDWGTGPKGEGKIFKISYTDPQVPQLVAAWAAGPEEVRIAFDKPLDPSVTGTVVRQEIEFGQYVRAADRYEVLKPPYAVVKQQEATPRGKLKILAAKLDNDGETLVLSTAPHPQAVTYALTIPGVKAKASKGRGEVVELDYDLSGVTVLSAKHKLLTGFQPVRDLALKAGMKTSEFSWNDWLPYPGVEFAKQFSGPSKYFAEAASKLSPGKGFGFRIITRPNFPFSDATLRVKSTDPFRLIAPGGPLITNSAKDQFGKQFADVALTENVQRVWVCASWKGGVTDAVFTYFTSSDPNERSVPPGFLLSPFVLESNDENTTNAEVASSVSRAVDNINLNGGDYERGRGLFFGDQLKCATCHRLRGEGGVIGPDLSNLVARDAGSVLRDIKEPSASINPDYVAYQMKHRDGSELTGFIRTQDGDSLHLVEADGKETTVRVTDVKELRPSSLSLMPAGLLDTLKDGQVRDLLTFLLHEPPKRTRAELEAALASTNQPSLTNQSPLRLVLVANAQDHGPGQHDYPAWQKKWGTWLRANGAAKVATAWEWPTTEQFQSADLLVFYYWNRHWDAEKLRQLDEFSARGGGMVVLHSATIGNPDSAQLAERIGLASDSGRTKYLHTPMVLQIVAPTNHPITRGLPSQIHFIDEPYWPLIGDTKNVEVLATTEQDGQAWPMMWTFQKGKGRVFGSILGHYTWTLDDPVFRILILRGIGWAAGADPATLEPLAIKEADLK